MIYKARALYNLIFAKNDVFSDDCISSNFSKSMTQVSEIESSDELILYPNPAKDEIFIQVNNIETTQLEIQVLDATGKYCFEPFRFRNKEWIDFFYTKCNKWNLLCSDN